MRKIRWLICGVSAAAFLVLGDPVWAQGILNADSLKLYGDTYSSACSNPAAPRGQGSHERGEGELLKGERT